MHKVLVTILLLTSIAMGGYHTEVYAQEAVTEQIEYVFYHGVIASINSKKGILTIMGSKDGDEGKNELIVKFEIDLEKTFVADSTNQDIQFSDLKKGDLVDVDAYYNDSVLAVDMIYVYGNKNLSED